MSFSPLNLERARKVLLLGAHADDIEIGCGGTVLRLLRDHPTTEIHWHVFSAPGPRRREALGSARKFLRCAKNVTIGVEKFRESYFPDQWASIKGAFEKIHGQFEPDVIFTHQGCDRHQDHRVLSELAWNTFRNHAILEYEIPKYDGDLGHPNCYVALEESLCRRKVSEIISNFRSQKKKHWFTEDTFLALLRLRGVECGPRTRYAEAFYARKLVC